MSKWRLVAVFLSAALLVAAVSLSAAVLDIQNFERNGKPVLVPKVHAYKAFEGVCKLPRDFTVFVPKGEELIVEQLKSEARRFDLAVLPGNKGAFCRRYWSLRQVNQR